MIAANPPHRPRRAATERALAVALFALPLAHGCDRAPVASAARPNVLLYVADTLRADGLACYGNEVVDTPAIDRFAAEGMVFERAYAPSSWTRASMASILTGTNPAVHGAEGRYDLLDDSAVLLSELFAAGGYRVGEITTNRNVGSFFGFDQGFAPGDFVELYPPSTEERVDVSELMTLADEVTRRAIEWLEGAPEPFCLVVHTIDPHSPYTPPGEWDRYGEGIESRVDGSRKSLFALQSRRTPEDEARVRSLYWGEIAFNDHAFGELLDWLRERELLDRTAVALTSDHGEEFWEHGLRGHGKSLNEMSLHVPLILRYPSRLAAGSRVPTLVGTVDLLPTLLELAHLEVPDWIEGRSLLLPASNREPILFSSCKLGDLELYSARTDRWKLVFDARTGKKELFDLGDGEVEGADVLAKHRDEGRELFRALASSMEHEAKRRLALYGTAEARRVGQGDMPQDVRRDLNDLGYLDSEGEEESPPKPPGEDGE